MLASQTLGLIAWSNRSSGWIHPLPTSTTPITHPLDPWRRDPVLDAHITLRLTITYPEANPVVSANPHVSWGWPPCPEADPHVYWGWPSWVSEAQLGITLRLTFICPWGCLWCDLQADLHVSLRLTMVRARGWPSSIPEANPGVTLRLTFMLSLRPRLPMSRSSVAGLPAGSSGMHTNDKLNSNQMLCNISPLQ